PLPAGRPRVSGHPRRFRSQHRQRDRHHRATRHRLELRAGGAGTTTARTRDRQRWSSAVTTPPTGRWMQALDLLARYAATDGKVRFYADGATVPIGGVVPKAWQEAVVDDKGRIERIPYELCVLVALRDALRRREIYVIGGNRWRNPEEDLPGDFEASREVHYAPVCPQRSDHRRARCWIPRGRTRVPARVRAYGRAYVGTCGRAGVRACVRAYGRAYVG